MFRLYSKGCEYALRALVCAVQDGKTRRFQAKDVCEQAGIPEPFTRKVLQALVQGGFLNAVRGPGGGYELSRPPKEISLLEVIRAVDGEYTFDGCIMGLEQCGDTHPCPLHPVWLKTKGWMLEQLESQTLQELLDVESAQKSKRPKQAVSKTRHGKGI